MGELLDSEFIRSISKETRIGFFKVRRVLVALEQRRARSGEHPPISRVDEPTEERCTCPPEPMAHDPLYQCVVCEQRQIDALNEPTEEME